MMVMKVMMMVVLMMRCHKKEEEGLSEPFNIKLSLRRLPGHELSAGSVCRSYITLP